MTGVVAAGNGFLSHGLYRGLASEAEVVLIQGGDPDGHITNATIARAFRWLLRCGRELGLRVVSASVGGDPVAILRGNPVDEAAEALVESGISVVVAAGNDRQRRLLPPATAPLVLTIGGIDDRNTFSHDEIALWHSNMGGPTTKCRNWSWWRPASGWLHPYCQAPAWLAKRRNSSPVAPQTTAAAMSSWPS